MPPDVEVMDDLVDLIGSLTLVQDPSDGIVFIVDVKLILDSIDLL